MQFRDMGGRTQCLVAIYDPESKRTRQKLVFSMDKDEVEQVPAPADLSFGSPDQREAWSQEIADFVADRRDRLEKDAIKNAPNDLEMIVDKIVHDHDSQLGILTDEDREKIQAQILRLMAVFPRNSGLPRGVRSARTGKAVDPRGFGEDVKARARELRLTNSIARVSEILTEEGHPVSRSWVQKWTS
jgi:hypothetical protein